MLARLFIVFVVLFWAASVGWLCAVVWAPPESRMARVNPREVYDTFFAWNDSTRMTLLENGTRRGQLTISGGSGEDPDTGVFSNTLSFSSSLEREDPISSSTVVDLFAKGVLEWSRGLSLESGEFAMRVPERQLTAHFSFEGRPPLYDLRVASGRREVFRFEGRPRKEGPPLPTHLLPMGSMLDPAALAPTSMEWKSEARMGDFTFGGRDLRAYLLILTPSEGAPSLRIYFSESGEPLRIEGDFGFVAISEILVPLDAYRETASRMEKKTLDPRSDD